uniref:hypothetical protein n=1 Tax=Trichocoleus desertorum TaxID=1481672 RepID=UPI0025B36893|nr:hypothetical protein [Trichocoleus desertorum]
MPKTAYEALIRFNPQGGYQGASIKYWDSDRNSETAPEDLGAASDPRFQDVIGTALTIANTQVVELQAQLATAQADAAEVPSLRSRITQLEAELEGYRNPPQPEQSYVGLYNALLTEGLSLFLFVRAACDVSLPVSNAYTDLVAALLTPMPSLTALQACFDNLFAAMSASGFGFGTSQIEQMRSLLDGQGFQAVVFPLGG